MALQRSSHLGEAAARPRPALPLILGDIKLAHTVFAMPFALMGALLAADGLPSLWELTWIVVAVVGARSAAMAFNRLVDAPLDAAHDRTEGRPLPSGKASPRHYKAFIAGSIALFELAAWMLNSLAFLLSPLVLAIILGYSYTKRFTRWSHLWLGVALACAPIGAWIAIRGDIALAPLLLGVAVAFWVAGFDTLYACQDVEHDAAMGLQTPCDSTGNAGNVTTDYGAIADQQIREVAGVRKDGEVEVVHREARAVQAGRDQRSARRAYLLRVGFCAQDHQV